LNITRSPGIGDGSGGKELTKDMSEENKVIEFFAQFCEMIDSNGDAVIEDVGRALGYGSDLSKDML